MALEIDRLSTRLKSLSGTSDQIVSLAKLAFLNKVESDQFCTVWLDCLRRERETNQLNYFYVANEILQTCCKKDASVYIGSFKKVLLASLRVANGKTYVEKVSRVINIWMERAVFKKSYINRLLNILRGHVDNAQGDADFNSEDLVLDLRRAIDIKHSNQEAFQRLKQNEMYTVELDHVQTHKDRDSVVKFDDKVTTFVESLSKYIQLVDDEVCNMEKLIRLLGICDTVFSAQFNDVQHVVTAYQEYAKKIDTALDFVNLKIERVGKKTEPESPPSTPDINCPSPTNTLSESDDMKESNTLDQLVKTRNVRTSVNNKRFVQNIATGSQNFNVNTTTVPTVDNYIPIKKNLKALQTLQVFDYNYDTTRNVHHSNAFDQDHSCESREKKHYISAPSNYHNVRNDYSYPRRNIRSEGNHSKRFNIDTSDHNENGPIPPNFKSICTGSSKSDRSGGLDSRKEENLGTYNLSLDSSRYEKNAQNWNNKDNEGRRRRRLRDY